MKLIGIVGKAHSGKDTLCSYGWSEYAFTRIALADPLKMAAQHIFALTDKQTWGDELKEVVIPYWGMSPRTMFQLLGTEAAKPTFGNDVWCKRWALTYDLLKDTDNVICTDVRVDIEAALIRSYGGVIIEIQRNSAGLVGINGAHSSESGLSLPPDYTIDNNGTIGDMHKAFDLILQKLDEGSKND